MKGTINAVTWKFTGTWGESVDEEKGALNLKVPIRSSRPVEAKVVTSNGESTDEKMVIKFDHLASFEQMIDRAILVSTIRSEYGLEHFKLGNNVYI